MDVFWCNSAARKRAGRLLTSEEQDAVLMSLPDAAGDAMAIGLAQIHEDVLVRSRSMLSGFGWETFSGSAHFKPYFNSIPTSEREPFVCPHSRANQALGLKA